MTGSEYFRQISLIVKFGRMMLIVTRLAKGLGCSTNYEGRIAVFRVQLPRSMADLALDIFKTSDLTENRAARSLPPGDVAPHTFRIEGFVRVF